jgi:putative oxidoreductase
MTRFFQTDRSRIAFLQRLILAAVIFPHGAQKLLGWFGGWGLEGTLAWFQNDLGAPAIVGVLVILGDFFGMIALAAGLATRFAAAGAALTMAGAIVFYHAQFGFWMNWSGTQAGEGFQFHLLALALAIPLVVTGGGAWSLDGWIARRLTWRINLRGTTA